MMKKLVLTLLLISLLPLKFFAQEEPLDYDELKRKFEKSNKAILNPKKNTDAELWLERAKLLVNINDVNTQYIGLGSTTIDILKQRKGNPSNIEKSANGRDKYVYEKVTFYIKNGKVDAWEDTKTIEPNAIDEALKALIKCDSLDVKKTFSAESRALIKRILIKYKIKASIANKFGKTEETLAAFKKIVVINETKLDTVDMSFAYNIGMLATSLKNYDEAISYYQKAADKQYHDSTLYFNLTKLYYAKATKEDSAKALNTTLSGIKIFPENVDLLVSVVSHYLNQGQRAEAMQYITKAKDKLKPGDKNIKLFTYVEGVYNYQIGSIDKAVELWNKALELDSNYFSPYYRLGDYYLLQAEDLYKLADKEKSVKKFEEKKAPAIELFKKALVYYEKAYAMRPEEQILKTNLRRIYIRLGMRDKAQQLKDTK
jgi:tetratricopeptide (TPR) repeat protein